MQRHHVQLTIHPSRRSAGGMLRCDLLRRAPAARAYSSATWHPAGPRPGTRQDRVPGARGCPRVAAARSRFSRTAFTLMELVVVLMIISIAAAAAAPTFFRSLRHHQVESAARRVKLDLEQIRRTARVTSRVQSMTFAGSSYTLSADVEDLDHGGAAYTVDLADAPFDLDSVTIDFGGPTAISFDGYGDPSAGGTIVLGQGDEGRTVALDGSTGQITISSN